MVSGPDKDRRTYRRVLLRLPLQFCEEGGPGIWQPGVTVDISAVGLLFSAPRAMPLGTRLVTLLQVPEDPQPRRLTGVVVRTEYREEPSGYLIGLTFTDLSDADRHHIATVLHSSDIVELLRKAVQVDASDVHFSANHPPMMRLAGRLMPIRKSPIGSLDLKHMVYTLLDERQRQAFERDLELDFSLSLESTVRFRVNVHSQRGNVEAAFRRIEPAVRTIQELNLPAVVEELANQPDGLVLVVGRTGAGKTTTLAAMIDHINASRTAVIVTLEKPIEYVFTYKKSIVKQREVGIDTRSFQAGLREAMRQNPDVIVVGEILDEDTMKGMLDAAESGHLVFATMAAGDCVHALSRIINFFHKDRQLDAQMQLMNCLRAIVYQELVPRAETEGVVPATEVLINTQAVSNLIRSGNHAQIPSVIQVSMKQGMHSIDSSLQRLYRRRLISLESAQKRRRSISDAPPV